jgi:hypothetical protein
MTAVDEAKPAGNKGSVGANALETAYLLTLFRCFRGLAGLAESCPYN